MTRTPSEQARLVQLDAMIADNKRAIAPVKAERRKLLLRAYQRNGRDKGE